LNMSLPVKMLGRYADGIKRALVNLEGPFENGYTRNFPYFSLIRKIGLKKIS
jgi:hypothetical protein